jgi:hypothetical protein
VCLCVGGRGSHDEESGIDAMKNLSKIDVRVMQIINGIESAMERRGSKSMRRVC